MPSTASRHLVVAALALAACGRGDSGETTPAREPSAGPAPGVAPAPSGAAAPSAATPASAGGEVVPASGEVTAAGAPQNYVPASAAGKLEISGTETQYDIQLPADVLFDFDKADIRADAAPLLEQVRQHLTTHPADQVHVRGHTDSEGSDQYNAVLSQRRAKAVADWLKANVKVRGLVMALGLGEREPLVPNQKPDGTDDPVARQRNRRVTLGVVAYPDVNAMLAKARRP